MRPKLTWWFSSSMTDTAARLSDEALAETIDLVKLLCRIGRGEATVKTDPPVYRMWKYHLMGLHVYGCVLSMEAAGLREMEDSFYEFSSPARSLQEATQNSFKLPPWYVDHHVIQSHIATATRENTYAWMTDGNDDMSIPLASDDDEWWPVLWPIMLDENEYELKISKSDREALERDDLWLPDDVRARVVNLD